MTRALGALAAVLLVAPVVQAQDVAAEEAAREAAAVEHARGLGSPSAVPAATAWAPEDAAPAPTAPPEPPAFGGRALVARYALRPLTVTEGVLRIDHGSACRLFGLRGFGMVISMVEGFTLGVTNDLEIGVSFAQAFIVPPVLQDPIVAATYRFVADTAVELGVRASVRVPVVTTGDTVVRVGIPIVVHGGDFFRMAAAIDLDLLLTANVSPLVSIPVQLAFSTGERFSLGAEGWLGILNGTEVLGSVGAFVQATGRTRVRALWDVRWAMAYLVTEQAVQITSAVTFYPQLW